MADTEMLVVGPCSVRFPNLEDHEEFGGVSTGKYEDFGGS